MTFEFLSIFHDFPGKFVFPGFSMIFHDRGNPEGRRAASYKASSQVNGQIVFHTGDKMFYFWCVRMCLLNMPTWLNLFPHS